MVDKGLRLEVQAVAGFLGVSREWAYSRQSKKAEMAA